MTERKSFDEQLEEAKAEVVKLASRVGEQIARATQAILDGDLEVVDTIYAEHGVIGIENREIEQRAYRIFALQQPIAVDLRVLLAVLRILHELELTAGLMRNVARATRRLYPRQLSPRIRGIIERMGSQASTQMRIAIDAFADNDPIAAAALPDMDDVMDELQKDLFRRDLRRGRARRSRAPAGRADHVRRARLRARRRPRGHDRSLGALHRHWSAAGARRRRLIPGRASSRHPREGPWAEQQVTVPALFTGRSTPIGFAVILRVYRARSRTRVEPATSERGHHVKLLPARRSAKYGAGTLALALALAACGSSSNKSSDTTASNAGTSGSSSLNATLNGSGSTFQLPFEQALIAKFTQDNPGVKINYPGGGSSKGKADLAAGLVDFAGSDSLLKDSEVSALNGKTALYFPMAAAPVTVSYHLSGVSDLQLSPNTIADIFQAKVKKWDDPEIKADNPSASLPSTAITVAHRADGSGTTNNFTHFLTLAAPNWTLGKGDTVNWPAGTQSGQGNAGVATVITQTDGAIGYVDYADAKAANLTFAKVKNAAGEYQAPTTDGSSKAIAGATVADDLTYAPQNAPGSGVYPITAPTWILVFEKQTDKAKGDALKAYLNFMLTTGQQIAPTVNYAPLSSDLDQKAIAQLDKLQIG